MRPNAIQFQEKIRFHGTEANRTGGKAALECDFGLERVSPAAGSPEKRAPSRHWTSHPRPQADGG